MVYGTEPINPSTGFTELGGSPSIIGSGGGDYSLVFHGQSGGRTYLETLDPSGNQVLTAGAQLAFRGDLADSVRQSGRQSFSFSWHSIDPILGELKATLGTAPASGMESSWVQGDGNRPSRLVFTGTGAGATFSGNVLLGASGSPAVVDVSKDGKRVRYVLQAEPDPIIAPSLSISDVAILEGDTGTKTANVVVSLSQASGSTVTANYVTRNGTATAGEDYDAAQGQVAFLAGETQKTIPIVIRGDQKVESDETFGVVLSNPVNATLLKAEAEGQIVNDDQLPSDITAPVADSETATVAEGGTSSNLALLSGDTDAPDDPSGAGLQVAVVNGVALSTLTPQSSGTYAGFYGIAGSNGTLHVKTDGTAFYVHNGSDTTSDAFSYRARDGAGNLSNTASVALTITPVDDTAPVADSEIATVAEGGTSSNLALLSGDTDAPDDPSGAGLQVAVVNGVALSTLTPQSSGTYAGFYGIAGSNGTLHVKTDGTAFYVHNGSDTTSDAFSYRARDGAGNLSNTASVALTITPVDDTAPVADSEIATVAEGGTSSNLALLSGDTDAPDDPSGAGLQVAVVNGVALSSLTPQSSGTYAGFYGIAGSNGTLHVKTDGTAFYVHNGSDTTSDAFSYRARDGAGNLSNTASVSLTITPVDDTAPVVNAVLMNDTGRSSQDRITQDPTVKGLATGATTLWGALNGASYLEITESLQPDGSFRIGAQAYNKLSQGSMPDGAYQLRLKARSTSGAESVASEVVYTLDRTAPTVSFDLAPESDTGPQGDQATTEQIVTLKGQSEQDAEVRLQATSTEKLVDPQGQFSFSGVTMPSAGAGSFTVIATDVAGNQGRSREDLTRIGINGAPKITSTPETDVDLKQTTLYSYQVAATDPDQDTLAFVLVRGPKNAQLSVDGLLTFMPAPSTNSDYSFAIQVSDGRGGVDQQEFVVKARMNPDTGTIRGGVWDDLNRNGIWDKGTPDTNREVLINNGTEGYFNGFIGDLYPGDPTNPLARYFPGPNISTGDPSARFAIAPELSGVAALGNWLGSPESALSSQNWSQLGPIPFSWPTNAELAIVYEIDGGKFGIDNLRGNFGADNGIYVWVNGEFRFGALDPGPTIPNEYANIDLGSLKPCTNYIQILLEDHGNILGYDVEITGNRRLDEGETGLALNTIYLDLNNNKVLNIDEPTQRTSGNSLDPCAINEGAYEFSGLAPGTYVVRSDLPRGWDQTYPSSLQLGNDIAVNGSFEMGPEPGNWITLGSGSVAIPGWDVLAGSVDYKELYWKASDGVRSIDLNGNETGGFRQIIPTIPGQRYKVVFELAGNPERGYGPDVKELVVSAGATSKTLVFDTTSTSLADLGWRREEMEFTANSPNTNLDFLSKIPGFTGPVIDNVRVYPILQKDNAWTVEVKAGEVKENINFGLARNKDYTGEHDLQITSIDAEQLTVDPQLLTVEGPVTATIKNAGVDPLNKPFTVAFFEDRNYDKVYDSNLDTLLSTVEVDKSIAGGASLSVTADLSTFMAFAHAPIWGVVDLDNVVVETDESNNLNFSASDCLIDPPPKPQLLKEIFAFGGGGFPQEHIYRVDLSTGSTTDLGFSGIGFPTNLAMTADRTIYYMNPFEPHALYKSTLNPSYTALVEPGTFVANLPTAGLGVIDGLTAGPDGSLYMTGYGKSEIYRYDLTTDQFTTEVVLQDGGTTGGEFRSDLAFDPKTGNLVGLGIEPGTSNRKLFEIPLSLATNGRPDIYSWTYYGGNTSAWASKSLNTGSEIGGNPDGIAFDPTNGDLYMTGDGTGIYSYDRDTAVRGSLIASTGDGSLNGLGFDLAFQTVKTVGNEGPITAPDLIASYLRTAEAGGVSTATIRIGNAGSIFVAAGVNVAFYEGDPRTGARLLGVSQTSKRLEVGAFEDVTLTVASSPLSTLWVVADDDGTGVGKVRECDEENNFYSLLGPGKAEIRGTVWSDRNGDGTFNRVGDASETGLSGVTVYLDVNNNQRLDAGEPSRQTSKDNPRTADTNETGQYRFNNLSYGSYIVRELVPTGYQQTVPSGAGGATVALNAANPLQEVNLGNGSIPVITSTPVRSVYAGTNYSYAVQTNDAGGGGLTYQLLEGPQGMAISSAGVVSWTPGTLGTVPVTLEVRNPAGAKASQSYQVVVEADLEAPVISLRPSGTVFNPGETLTLNLSATDNVAVTDLRLTLNGSPLSLIPNLPTQPNQATVVLNQLGSYTIEATATDSAGNVGMSTLQVRVPDPTDKTPPDISLNLASFDPTKPLTKVTDLVGSITGDPNSWRVELAPINLVDPGNPAAPDPDYITIGSGTGNTLNATLATIDPSLFRNDNYLLRVISEDFSGNIEVKSTVVGLFSEEKPADFKLDFTDLTIPLTGLPIQIGRSYSSLDAQVSGDFGYGWNLSFQDAQIQESAPDGRNLNDDDPFFGNSLTVGTRVTLTNPEGRRVGFTFDPQFVGSVFLFGNLYRPYFRPDAGVFDTLDVSLESGGLESLVSLRGDGSAASPGFIPFTYNPSTYFLRTKAGDTYQYNQNAGLIDITDRNGNKLSYSNSGILSSTGKSINFTRDGEGRITEIRDPEGKVIKYSYNALGELVGVTDRTGNTTTMEYKSSRPHYLSKVVDPLGRTASRTEYDDQGRVKRILDAEGNALDLSYDTNARVQVVKDPLGHTITLISDERGNVIEQVDANGGITRRTYDTNNNVLTNTDPEGNTTTYSYDNRGNKLNETNPEGEKRTFEYSPTNKLLKETDALGFSTTYTYDARDNLLSRTDANGKTTTYAYDARGQMTSITDANGKLSTFSYDTTGNLKTLTDPTGAVTSFTYDANGQVKSMTDPLGAITNYVYDSQGRLIEKADPEGSSCGCARGITKTEYNKAGEKVAEIDALGRRTEYRYNNRGLLVETILPDDTAATNSDNPRLRLDYDAADRKISSTDELGRITFYVYDKLGQLIETIYPDATPTTLDDNPRMRKEYDKAGRVIAEVDELGQRKTMGYDKAGRLIEQTNALGETTTHSYDDDGRKVSMTDALGRITRYSYDGMDRLVSTTYANNSTATTTYDALGRVIQETDLAGLNTRYEYDPLGRLTAVVDALNQRTEYTYDKVGNLITQKDANGHVTTFTYDSLRRRVDMVLPEGQLKKTIHDKIGNLIRSTDANGVTTTYKYDARNWLIEKAFSDGTPTETFTYTATGQLKTVTDNRGTTEYAYDERDRLLSRTEPDGRTITYTYDKAGNIRTLSVPSGSTSYTYDALNRLDTVTDPDGGVTDYDYDAVGNLKTTTFANGVVESRDYDPLNRLLYLENRGVAGVLSSYRYSLDAMGNRLKVEEQDGRTVSYSYDKLYRLTKEQIVDPSNGNRTVSFEYDPVGNRLKRIDSLAGTTTYSYDNNDRLLAEVLAGQTITYSYDNNGSLTAKAINGQIEAEYRWNAKGELSAATVRENGSTNVVSFEYDHQGMRVAATVNGQETRFLLDTTQQTFAQVIEEYLATGSLSRSYTYGRDLLSQDDTSTRSYYQVDGLGSTRHLADASGNVTLTYDYQAFGELLQKVGSGDNRYLFAGEQFDESVDLTYLRARYYDMTTGRFTSVDQFEGIAELPSMLHDYVYVASNPVQYTDYSGFGPLVDELVILSSGGFGMQEMALSYIGLVVGYALPQLIFIAKAIGFIFNEGDKTAPMSSAIRQTEKEFKAFIANISRGRGAPLLIPGGKGFSDLVGAYTSGSRWEFKLNFPDEASQLAYLLTGEGLPKMTLVSNGGLKNGLDFSLGYLRSLIPVVNSY